MCSKLAPYSRARLRRTSGRSAGAHRMPGLENCCHNRSGDGGRRPGQTSDARRLESLLCRARIRKLYTSRLDPQPKSLQLAAVHLHRIHTSSAHARPALCDIERRGNDHILDQPILKCGQPLGPVPFTFYHSSKEAVEPIFAR
ncbi:hypothetical protein Cob_v005819 [Colletotrichum orbiculare MAFF 240422]|uniref:Uncharacterized protein n=1 Tax=Colletotrichum orbiculare (strain 104-T / ATCC 96160 / CBS 514.97 / LARS 414 / MAFF 240422) TaxID=1213857 RepID=A0A484FTA6_COLOR|nr:hypothetical protein Cob_v005819 [Colletotrichum orbiculare MAFF 240422]